MKKQDEENCDQEQAEMIDLLEQNSFHQKIDSTLQQYTDLVSIHKMKVNELLKRNKSGRVMMEELNGV